MFYDHIAQFYKDQFVLKKGERAKLVRDFETDEKGRQVYDIKPGDKFIADVKCGGLFVSKKFVNGKKYNKNRPTPVISVEKI